MRISELSITSGIAVPTIKYYLRESLLPAGEALSANQADYNESHVRRLRLIRALIDVGGLSVASARAVIEAVDAEEMPLSHVFGTAQFAISQSDLYSTQPSPEARARVTGVVDRLGWQVSEGNPGLTGAANVVDAFAGIGHPELVGLIDDYATSAESVARADLAAVGRQADVAAMAETVVAGTVLGDAMFAALRRIAQEHISREQFPESAPPHPVGRPTRIGNPPTLAT